MDKDKIKDFFLKNNKSGYKTNEKWLRKNHPDLYEAIINNSTFNEISFKEKIWLYINNQSIPPQCPLCGKYVNFQDTLNKGYNNFCSHACLNSSDYHKNLIKNNNIKKYGVESHNQLDYIKRKKEKTVLKNYGVTNPFKSKKIREKAKNTIIDRYGVNNVIKIKCVVDNKIESFVNGTDPNMKRMLDRIAKSEINNLRFLKYNNTLKKHTLHCNDCSNEIQLTANHIDSRLFHNKKICTICNPLKDFSSNEKILHKMFENNNINYIVNDRNVLMGKEIDVLIPDYNLGIEHNGLYWHSSARKNDKNFHYKKTINAKKKGIKLFHVFEDEINNNPKIIESMIMSELGIYKHEIDINDCQTNLISNVSSIKDFLNFNHIKGYCRFHHKYGLFHNSELVSLLTLKKRGDDEDKHYNISRFCDIINTKIDGSFNMLLNKFLSEQTVKKISILIDRRHDNSDFYVKHGFKYHSFSKPKPQYVLAGKFDRYSGRAFKNVVSKQNPELVENKDYFIIYDSGSLRYDLDI